MKRETGEGIKAYSALSMNPLRELLFVFIKMSVWYVEI
jgi:hypothetical protein